MNEGPLEMRLESGRYSDVAAQAGGRSFTGTDELGRRVVLKRLERDCMLKQQLHPMVKDRLQRVRELAHLGVAQLYGVERSGGEGYLVWEHVEGVTLGEYAERRPERALRVLSVVMEHVAGMHAMGIVHGALHERNIIVGPDETVKLTHVSPLLYAEEEADVSALVAMLRRMGVGAEADAPTSLRELARGLALPESMGAQEAGATPEGMGAEREGRWRLLVAAGLLVALGGLIGWGIWRFADRLKIPALYGFEERRSR